MTHSAFRKAQLPILISILLLSTTILIYHYLNTEKRTYIIHHHSYGSDALCQNKKQSSDLRAFRNSSKKSIFFHETSCNGGLLNRQACAVEAAARLNPEWKINVLFSAPVNRYFLTGPVLKALKTYPNVKFSRIHIKDYTKGTPLETYIISGVLNRNSFWAVPNSGDILRYVSLYKFGGVYLDLNLISVKSIDELPANWLAISYINIGAGAMGLAADEAGKMVSRAAIGQYLDMFHPDYWNLDSDYLINKAFTEVCINDNYICNEVVVLDVNHFYPVMDHYQYRYYVENASEIDVDMSYGHFFWDTGTQIKAVPKRSPFHKIISKYCPKIYEMFGNDFFGY